MTGRDRVVIVIVAMLAPIVAAWMLVVAPKRDEAAKLGGQVQTAQRHLDTVRAQLAQGEAAHTRFASAYAQLVRLGEAVPADDNVPSLIYQIQSAASGAGVDFRSLQLSGGGASGSSASSAPPASNAGTSGSQSTGGTSSAQGGAGATLPPGVTVGPAGFPAEQFTFSFRGNFFRLADFFNRLQRFVVADNNRISISGRLMTLNAITLGPAPSGFPQITATVSATTYMVPASQGVLAGASPAGPASPAPAPVSSTSGSQSAVHAATVTPSSG